MSACAGVLGRLTRATSAECDLAMLPTRPSGSPRDSDPAFGWLSLTALRNYFEAHWVGRPRGLASQADQAPFPPHEIDVERLLPRLPRRRLRDVGPATGARGRDSLRAAVDQITTNARLGVEWLPLTWTTLSMRSIPLARASSG